jgi:hypothetical protein
MVYVNQESACRIHLLAKTESKTLANLALTAAVLARCHVLHVAGIRLLSMAQTGALMKLAIWEAPAGSLSELLIALRAVL